MSEEFRVGHLVLKKLAPVDQLSPRVIRILACNPGNKTLQGTNTYLVGTGRRRVLIDAGEAGKEAYVATMASVLREHDVDIEYIIITHWHPDHVGGVDDVCSQVLKRTSDNRIDVWKIQRQNGEDLGIGDLATYRYLHDGQILKTEGATLKIIHTPGHSDDNICLLLEEENAMFTGDCILGETSSYYENYSDLHKSLTLILDYKPSVLYPGHGPIVMETISYITSYIEHRQMRERQILETLKSASRPERDGWWSVDEIVANIYEGLVTFEHKGIAKLNTTNHLTKLLQDGVVECVTDITGGGDTKWRYTAVN